MPAFYFFISKTGSILKPAAQFSGRVVGIEGRFASNVQDRFLRIFDQKVFSKNAYRTRPGLCPYSGTEADSALSQSSVYKYRMVVQFSGSVVKPFPCQQNRQGNRPSLRPDPDGDHPVREG